MRTAGNGKGRALTHAALGVSVIGWRNIIKMTYRMLGMSWSMLMNAAAAARRAAVAGPAATLLSVAPPRAGAERRGSANHNAYFLGCGQGYLAGQGGRRTGYAATLTGMPRQTRPGSHKPLPGKRQLSS
jgi:hypothetical protein